MLHRRADALHLVGRDVLTAVQPGGQTIFARALSQALAAQDGEPPPAIFRIEAPGGALSVMMAPAGAYLPGTEAVGTVCVFVADPGQKPIIDPALLAQEFGLTPAETHVVAALAGGASVKQIAAQRDVSPNTVLIQIKHVLAKTSTRSQTQLVSAVLRGLAATAPV
jgi:DNA-binding CsgD family transcriptional regulator